MSQTGKASEHWDDRYLNDLCKALASFHDATECRSFLEDLCTPAELRSMADRWRVARLLKEGFSYRLINEKTGVSTATITRVARAMTYGANGYARALERGATES